MFTLQLDMDIILCLPHHFITCTIFLLFVHHKTQYTTHLPSFTMYYLFAPTTPCETTYLACYSLLIPGDGVLLVGDCLTHAHLTPTTCVPFCCGFLGWDLHAPLFFYSVVDIYLPPHTPFHPSPVQGPCSPCTAPPPFPTQCCLQGLTTPALPSLFEPHCWPSPCQFWRCCTTPCCLTHMFSLSLLVSTAYTFGSAYTLPAVGSCCSGGYRLLLLLPR